jgi:hypothetical protein
MRKYFYELLYEYSDKNGKHNFQIGYFSTYKKAQYICDIIKFKPGFCNHNGDFIISKFAVNFDYEVKDKSKVNLYELSHEYQDDEGYDNWVIFGVFSSLEEAEKRKKEIEETAPYNKFPDGFCIADCKIDIPGWLDGFCS